MRALVEAREQLLADNPRQALQHLSEAVRLDPSEAAAFYYIAVARRALGHFDRAIQSFETTTRLARQQGDARMQARGLYGTAATLERTGELDDARRAWNAYAGFADAHLDLAYPDVARERVRMITVTQEARRIAREARSRAGGND